MNMTETRTNMAQDYADQLAATFDDILAAVEAGEEYEGQDPLEYLDEMPLELIAERGEPFSVVFTVGGPFAEVTWSGRSGPDYARLETAWGTDKGYRSSPAIRYIANYFSEQMDMES